MFKSDTIRIDILKSDCNSLIVVKSLKNDDKVCCIIVD